MTDQFKLIHMYPCVALPFSLAELDIFNDSIRKCLPLTPQEYADRQTGIPERREDMEYVPQPDEACPCKVSQLLHCLYHIL